MKQKIVGVTDDGLAEVLQAPRQTPWTPGPWTYDAAWALIIGPKREEICAVHSGAPDNTARRLQREIAQANARLIAKAPEMAEALKAIMRCYVGERGSRNVVGESGIVADKAYALLREIENGGDK